MTAAILACRLGEAVGCVREAAERADLGIVFWSGRREWRSGENPLFVVAGIPRGERRIPSDVVDIVTRVVPGAPLLLVCEEELASRTATLHRGRVTLLGPPLASGRLYSEMRTLLARVHARTLVRELARGASARERWGERHWLAQISGHPTEERASFALEDDVGITVVIGLDGIVQRKDAARGAAILRTAGSDSERTTELREAFGARVGLVHLDADAASWLIYWPSAGAQLVVHSPLRLPNVFRAPTPEGGIASLVRLQTCHGDVLVALASPLASVSLSDLASELAAGGPAAVDAIATRQDEGERIPAGFVMEVKP